MEEKKVTTKLDILKTVTGALISVGSLNIVQNIVTATTPAPIGLVSNICIKAATLAIGTMIGDVTSAHTNEKIDKIAEGINSGNVLGALTEV